MVYAYGVCLMDELTRSRALFLPVCCFKMPTLTGCQVERGLLECKSDGARQA